jgi:hypothetical protein
VRRADETGIVGVVLQRLPDLRHEVREVSLDDEGLRPESLEELALRHDPGLARDQDAEQVESLAGQVDFLPRSKDLTPLGVESAVVEANFHRTARF